jgi:thiol-disulfide isomerase/thioredoxin
MKKLKLVSLLFLLAFACKKNESIDDQGFIIEGHLLGEYSGFIYLKYLNETLDSTLLNADGSFILQGKLDHPVPTYLRLDYNSNLKWIALENSKITIKGRTIVDEDNNFNKIIIDELIGSKSQVLQEDLMDSYQDYFASNEPNFIKNQQFFELLDSFVTKNPKHYLSGWAVGQADFLTTNQLKTLRNRIDTTTQQKDDLSNIASLIRRGFFLSMGQKLPENFVINGDQKIQFKNKLTLIEFWASWCGPCRAKIPELNQILKNHENEFQIVGISFDKSKENWEKAIIDTQTQHWIHQCDFKGLHEGVSKEFGIYQIPYNLLIDENREIINLNIQEDKLEELLKSKNS